MQLNMPFFPDIRKKFKPLFQERDLHTSKKSDTISSKDLTILDKANFLTSSEISRENVIDIKENNTKTL